jgi:uncharacterized protein YqjF (DUF2071 family)
VNRLFLTAEWRYVVMLNFRIAPDVLAPFVPKGTELDPWRGEHWVSLVGFRFLDTRVLGVPVPGHRHFPEVNLRFYVRPIGDDRRAVVFLKEIVPRRAIATIARALYNEPYVARPMRAEAPEVPSEAPGRVSFAWRHLGRWNRFGVTASGSPGLIATGSAEEFFAEHYWGYTRQRDGSTIEYAVEHPRWRVWNVANLEFDVAAAAEYGPAFGRALGTRPVSAFIAEGSRVEVGRPHAISLTPSTTPRSSDPARSR